MKVFTSLLLVLVLIACQPATKTESTPSSASRDYYQIKTYHFSSDEQVVTTDQYLTDAYLPALKRAGISSVGVFKNRLDEKDSVRKIFILIPFKSMDEFLGLEKIVADDSLHSKNGAAYLTAVFDQKPYDRIESTLLIAFTEMPKMAVPTFNSPRNERVYELRSYESPTEAYYVNKVDMFNAGGEVKLFDKLQFNAVFYGDVISGAKMPNLMYMTTFSNMESREAHWKTFVDSPEWKSLSSMDKYQHNVSHADIMLLYPTEYSDY